ncbi:MAG: HIT domain-containing protein [Verrucomicrobia bacterium]|nr:HIT domain-containing protein [Verrucomicrobiota bacterium]MBV8273798.1 HIT domain-containing protein [Verrucomicrobiota bacterium]
MARPQHQPNRQAPLKLLLAHYPEQKPKPKKNFFCLEVERKKMPDPEEEPAGPIGPKVRVQTGRFRPISDRYPQLGCENLGSDQVERLKAACEVKLSEYLARRGDVIWDHRRRSTGYISGTLRYEVLKNAKFRCELCGVPADERALEVDHITPRNKGGTDEIANLQALCFSCNAMKRDRDDTDFRAVRREYDQHEQACPFCSILISDILIENSLSVAVRGKYPVTDWHILVVPKRHTADYFDLGTAESRACHQLITEARSMIRKADATVAGFNVGINTGGVAGQTVMHCHIHLIPRRTGDHPNPRGGVRAVIPE